MKTRRNPLSAKDRNAALEWPARIVAEIKAVEEYAGAKYPDGFVIGDLAWGDSPRVPVHVGDLRRLAIALLYHEDKLDRAIKAAFDHGATEWVRLYHPAHFERLSQTIPC